MAAAMRHRTRYRERHGPRTASISGDHSRNFWRLLGRILLAKILHRFIAVVLYTGREPSKITNISHFGRQLLASYVPFTCVKSVISREDYEHTLLKRLTNSFLPVLGRWKT